jgi:hypothetical protein
MRRKNHLSLFTAIFLISFFHVFVHEVSAGVIVYDTVTSSSQTVTLRARTKGRFFSEGGKLVSFYIDEKHIGTTLSGGDGYAFLKYLPPSSGLKHVTAKQGDNKDKGILLVTKRSDKVFLVEIDSTLFLPQVRDMFKPSEESKEATQSLSERFRIIYITTLIGMQKSRKWLYDNNFPPAPVLRWRGARMIADLQKQGVKPYAIIGSPALLSEAPDIEKRFSFDDTENGRAAKDWDHLMKLLE